MRSTYFMMMMYLPSPRMKARKASNGAGGRKRKNYTRLSPRNTLSLLPRVPSRQVRFYILPPVILLPRCPRLCACAKSRPLSRFCARPSPHLRGHRHGGDRTRRQCSVGASRAPNLWRQSCCKGRNPAVFICDTLFRSPIIARLGTRSCAVPSQVLCPRQEAGRPLCPITSSYRSVALAVRLSHWPCVEGTVVCGGKNKRLHARRVSPLCDRRRGHCADSRSCAREFSLPTAQSSAASERGSQQTGGRGSRTE